MDTRTTDLRALTVQRTGRSLNGTEIRPPRRWFSRIILPVILLGGFAALVVWAAKDHILPAVPVRVTPVVVKTGTVQVGGTDLFKASGWVEPRPTSIEVTALAPGVVDELFVLQGQRLKAGDVVAHLIEIDSRLELEMAEEELAERGAAVQYSEADIERATAKLRAATAQRQFMEKQRNVIDESRLAEVRGLEAAARAEVRQAEAGLAEAKAKQAQLRTKVRTAQLRLDRMTVRTPVGGIVMGLNTYPGQKVGATHRIAVEGTSAARNSLVTLYDPDKLQVRVEVPLDKFKHVRPGQGAIIEIEEVLAGHPLYGVVLYDTHEANIQRNTVPVKVGLADSPVFVPFVAPYTLSDVLGFPAKWKAAQLLMGWHGKLRPEMIAVVRFLAPPSEEEAAPQFQNLMLVPRTLLVFEEGAVKAWIVNQSNNRAELASLQLAEGEEGKRTERAAVTSGLRPTDKLITGGREQLQPGDRVRIVGEDL